MNKYYEILGVKPGSSKLQIKKAYYRLCLKLHPDVNPSPNAKQEFIAVNIAYEYLMKFGGKNYAPKRKTNYAKKKKAHANWQTKARKTQQKAKRRSEAPRYKPNTEMTAEMVLNLQWFASLIMIIAFLFLVTSFFILSHYQSTDNAQQIYQWSRIIGYATLFVIFYPILLGFIFSLKPKKQV